MGPAEIVTDLFGEACTLPSGRRGRPAHCWTERNHNRVLLGLAAGYTDAEIASGLGVSLPTLRKYYFSALQRRGEQRLRLDLWRLEKLAEAAEGGNVGAMKELGREMDKRDRELMARRLRDGNEDDARPQPERLGKKARQQAEAGRIAEGEGDGWGNLLTPQGNGQRIN